MGIFLFMKVDIDHPDSIIFQKLFTLGRRKLNSLLLNCGPRLVFTIHRQLISEKVRSETRIMFKKNLM